MEMRIIYDPHEYALFAEGTPWEPAFHVICGSCNWMDVLRNVTKKPGLDIVYISLTKKFSLAEWIIRPYDGKGCFQELTAWDHFPGEKIPHQTMHEMRLKCRPMLEAYDELMLNFTSSEKVAKEEAVQDQEFREKDLGPHLKRKGMDKESVKLATANAVDISKKEYEQAVESLKEITKDLRKKGK